MADWQSIFGTIHATDCEEIYWDLLNLFMYT